jgi:hypothetical protein
VIGGREEIEARCVEAVELVRKGGAEESARLKAENARLRGSLFASCAARAALALSESRK